MDHHLKGEVVMRSSTRDFKGQYPASIHISKSRELTLEITNLIGGTMGIIRGGEAELEVISPGKPELNRKGIRGYLGIPAALFLQLIHGDLPCPSSREIAIDGSEIVLRIAGQEWRYQRSDQETDSVPVRLRILESKKTKVDLQIENWNRDENYADKVRVQTAEGFLKWTWRSRVLEK
jgi:hypothetical protein